MGNSAQGKLSGRVDGGPKPCPIRRVPLQIPYVNESCGGLGTDRRLRISVAICSERQLFGCHIANFEGEIRSGEKFEVKILGWCKWNDRFWM